MKKLNIILLLFILSHFCLKSQEIVGGFKLSPNYSLTIDNNPEKDATDKEYPVVGSIGFGVGYFETMNLNEKYDLQAEVNYTMHSFNRKIKSTSSENNDYWSFSYLDVPFLVKRKFGALSTGFGLTYRKALSANEKNVTIINNKETIKETDLDKSSEINFLFDVSYKVNKMHFGVRLFRGYKNLLETGNPATYAAFNIGVDLF